MLYYILLIVLIVACHITSFIPFFCTEKRKKLRTLISVWLPICVLILLSTLKSNSVGTDTQTYIELYNEAKGLKSIFSGGFHNFSLLFTAFFSLCSKIGMPFRVFQLLIYSAIYLLFGMIIRKKSNYQSLSILIFVLWSWLLFDFSGIRQGLSDMICFFSVYILCIKTKDSKKAIAGILYYLLSFSLMILAVSLHKSSAVVFLFIPFYLLFRFGKKHFQKALFALALLVPVIMMLAPEIYQLFFYSLNINYYIPTNREGVGKLFLFYYLIYLFAIVFYKENTFTTFVNDFFGKLDNKFSFKTDNRQLKDNLIENDCLNMVVIGSFSIGVIIYSFSSVCYSMLRLSNIFLLPATIIIPNIISKQHSVSLRIIAQILIIFALGAVFYFDYYKINQLNSFPYSFL